MHATLRAIPAPPVDPERRHRRRLSVPGEGLAKVSYRLIEAETHVDQDLLVGGGDSAIEAALALSHSGRNRVTLS